MDAAEKHTMRAYLNMLGPVKAFPKRQILDSSKLKEFADGNFKFDENSEKFSERVQNTGKRRNCSLRAISPFPAMFSNDFVLQTCKN